MVILHGLIHSKMTEQRFITKQTESHEMRFSGFPKDVHTFRVTGIYIIFFTSKLEKNEEKAELVRLFRSTSSMGHLEHVSLKSF